MFVVSLVIDGTLEKNAIRHKSDEAVATAHSWAKEFNSKKHLSGSVIIDEYIRDEQDNLRFAEIKLGETEDKVRLTLMEKVSQNDMAQRMAPVAKQMFLTILELALFKANEYLREEQRKGKKRGNSLF